VNHPCTISTTSKTPYPFGNLSAHRLMHMPGKTAYSLSIEQEEALRKTVKRTQNIKYPFGMHMPGRTFSSGSYRYGFNGMEKDDEIKGHGNSLDFGARIYDSRLGRWLSVDPLQKKYPGLSVYNYSGNNPVLLKDIGGKKIYIYYDTGKKDENGKMIQDKYEYGSALEVPDNEFVRQTIAALDMISKVDHSNTEFDYADDFDYPDEDYIVSPATVVNELKRVEDFDVNISQSYRHMSTQWPGSQESNIEFSPYLGLNLIEYDPYEISNRTTSATAPPAFGLSHELKHAYNSYYLGQLFIVYSGINIDNIYNGLNNNIFSFKFLEELYTSTIYDNSFLNYYGMGTRKSYAMENFESDSSVSNQSASRDKSIEKGKTITVNDSKPNWQW
jgi:RHS repeat-associated protein